MDGEKLLSYQETFAVGDTAYLSQLRVSDEALSRHMGGLLLYEASQFWRRSGLVKQLCTGPTIPARPGISEFETRLGPTYRADARPELVAETLPGRSVGRPTGCVLPGNRSPRARTVATGTAVIARG
jgi:hypothetical protein